MATTIPEAFRTFKSNLEITGLQTSTVSTRQKNIREALENHLTVADSFLTGSYSRSTLIAPLKDADIDIFIILDADYFHHYNGKNGGQAGLLDLLKRTLKKTYSKTPDISRSGQAITIQFTDFNVDVVPAFHKQGGGYLIPNSIKQSWISTDPKKHVEIWALSNSTHNGDLVPLIKMIKQWNRTIDNYFMSFHLEAMVLQVLNNVRITDFPSGVRYFFDKGKDYVMKSNPDPAGYNEDIGDYINTQSKVDIATNRFKTAYLRALKAEENANRYDMGEAIKYWRMIFGDYFPVYG